MKVFFSKCDLQTDLHLQTDKVIHKEAPLSKMYWLIMEIANYTLGIVRGEPRHVITFLNRKEVNKKFILYRNKDDF